MSGNEKLTVAELLARAEKESGPRPTAARRRRHRSLEDSGGISVAELTGSMSKVKSKPAESRHSSIPIDTPESERRSRAERAQRVEQPTVDEGPAAQEHPGFAERADRPSPSTGRWSGPQQPHRPDPAPGADETAVMPTIGEGPTRADAHHQQRWEVTRVGAEPEGQAQGEHPSPQSPRPDQPAAARPSAESRPGSSAFRHEESEREGDRRDRVQQWQVGGANAAAGSAMAASAAAGERIQAPGPRAPQPPYRPVPERRQVPERAEDRVGGSDAPTRQEYQGRAEEQAPERTGEFPAGPSQASAASFGSESEPTRASGGFGTVLVLALIGIIIGAVIFVGFQQLWASGLSKGIVAILAFAVTFAMIGVTHALRTARDFLSMTLAGFVGLLMTFGPLIPYLFQ